jgi:transcriptional regulator with XRE-family HTH domain
VTWREYLGDQIRRAREAAGLTQSQLAEKTSVKREHISNIELGKNSPAVKIVTDIARALNSQFRVDGCMIGPSSEDSAVGPVPIPQQMKLDFGVEYRFNAESVSLVAHGSQEVEMRAILKAKHRA